jgi:ribonuclease P protein component
VGAEQLSGHAAPGAVQDSRSSISSKYTAVYRLLRADGFDHVFRGENIADKQFKIFFACNCENNARLGIIASKKILPSASERNRVKRIIREKFRQHNIKVCKLDIVVMVRRDFSWKFVTRIDNLEKLFSQVENRCAEW